MKQYEKFKTDGLIIASEWLGGLFGTPASLEYLTQSLTPEAQDSLHWIAEQLDASTEMQALTAILKQDQPSALTVHLQRRYTALFEGVFKHRAVLPYESAWRTSDAAIHEMHTILRALDLRVNQTCCEPPDHLAIELAALSFALRDEQFPIAAELNERLLSWVPQFRTALHQQDRDGFYAAAADLLMALLNKVHSTLAAHSPKQYEGEFA